MLAPSSNAHSSSGRHPHPYPPRVKVLPATPRPDGSDGARFFTTYETPRSEVVVFMSEPSDKDRPAPGWLKKSDMAASLGISVQAFDKWGVKPVKKIGRNVYFDVRSVVDNRIENAIQKHQPTDPQDMDEDQLDFQRWRLTKEQADKAERENRIAERHQVPTEFATFALTRIAAKVSSLLDTVPLTMRRRYPELQTKHIEGLQRELVIASNEAASLGDLLPELLDEYIDSTSK